MSDPTQETPESSTSTSTRRIALSNLGSIVAVAVSVFALVLGAYQTRLMQSQARASVWPYLSIGYTYSSNTDKDAFIWTVNNNGVGPAKVEYVTLKVDDKPMKNWDDVFAILDVTATSLSSATSTLDGDVIPPNTNRETTIEPIKINERSAAKLFKAAEHRFQMDVCYCSVYDDCWVAHWQKSKVDPVARCEVAGQLPFGG